MLRDLTIQNYRCFKDFHIDGLARVNLIVGANNSGKTSLLEAIYLLVNQGEPNLLTELLYNRGEISIIRLSTILKEEIDRIGYQINHIFNGHKIAENNSIKIASLNSNLLELKMTISPIEKADESIWRKILNSHDIPKFDTLFSFSYLNSNLTIPVFGDGLIEERFFRLAKQSLSDGVVQIPKCQFIITNNLSLNTLANFWDKIVLTPKEEKIIEALQILEPGVERISFTSRQTSNSGIILKLKGQSTPVPLGSMGEGMRRILTLAMAAVTVENGFLLVDEIDNGLYYEAQTDMWKLILSTAQQLNIQVFATTHSWDCIAAFQEALAELEDNSVGKLFRLSQRSEKIRAVEYTSDELSIAVRQSIEVR